MFMATLQAEQAGVDAARAQVQMKQAQEAAAAATRMRKLLDKRAAALRAKAETAVQVGHMLSGWGTCCPGGSHAREDADPCHHVTRCKHVMVAVHARDEGA